MLISVSPQAQITRQINAFTMGAQLVNPNVTVLVYYSMDWNNDGDGHTEH